MALERSAPPFGTAGDGMRIAALIKQVPAVDDDMRLGADGRLVRHDRTLEMNPYCRRAAAQAVELARQHAGFHSVTFVTMGPPAAEDVLREALAWAAERDVDARGILVCDPQFAGSDTIATARALAATLSDAGRFDIILAGKNSVDSDTGHVGPQLAEVLDLPFLGSVRHLDVDVSDLEIRISARCEQDDGWLQAELCAPAVLTTAERLIEPCKVAPSERALVPADWIRRVEARALGPGPWGQEGSRTVVGTVRTQHIERAQHVLQGTIAEQVEYAVALLTERCALSDQGTPGVPLRVPRTSERALHRDVVGVAIEPDRPAESRELLGAAAGIAKTTERRVAAFVFAPHSPHELGSWGADDLVHAPGMAHPEDAARALTTWAAEASPWAVLASSTAWGREVLARSAARLDTGLIGDAIELEADVRRQRLVGWKPAFGGALVAAIEVTSSIQMATIRPGALPLLSPREMKSPEITTVHARPQQRMRILARARDDDLGVLAASPVVLGVGGGVDLSAYDELEPLRRFLGAELGATRKVTDRGWLPRSRQIGITGRAIAPRLFISIAARGAFNHMVGVRAADTVLAINKDPKAPVFRHADIGIIGDWRQAVPSLLERLQVAVRT